jgi:hypothetical protein
MLHSLRNVFFDLLPQQSKVQHPLLILVGTIYVSIQCLSTIRPSYYTLLSVVPSLDNENQKGDLAVEPGAQLESGTHGGWVGLGKLELPSTIAEYEYSETT